jgi:putative MATE family efflux protein
MAYNEALLKGRVSTALIRFAIPVMLSSLLQIFYAATDLLIVGNFATTADVSGVSISSQIMTTVTLGLSGLVTGVTVLIGQYSGAKSEKDLKNTVGTSVIFFAVISAVIMALLLVLHRPIISLMQTPAEAVGPARSYLFICACGIPLIIGYNLVSSVFRGMGNSKTPLLFVAVACGINVILDLVLIKGFGMGAAGAALATVTAQGGSLMFSLLFIRRKGIGFHFTRADIHYRAEYIVKMLKIGVPISLQEILVGLSFVLITAVVNKMGVVASASVGIVEKLIGFMMMPTIAVSVAVATMSAQNIGARRYDRARESMWVGVVFSLSIAAVICAFSWIRGTAFTSLFSNSQEVVYQASLYLKTYSIDCLAVSFVFNMNAFFSSSNHSLFSMIHSLLTTFFIRVPVTVLFSARVGATLLEIGLAAPLSSVGSLVMCLIYFVYLGRKMKSNDPVFAE